jgi:endonuclease-3 related protein
LNTYLKRVKLKKLLFKKRRMKSQVLKSKGSKKTEQKTSRLLIWIFERLLKAFGPRNWWPADTPFEVAVGAILTQNTTWSNVEKAIRNLKKEQLLNAEYLKSIKLERLADLIKPCGYYNVKAKRLKNFVEFLIENYEGKLKRLFEEELNIAREKLLGIKGIGMETADSILLYAGSYPIFVVDAYTKRVFSRHHFFKHNATYQEIQDFFMENLPCNTYLFNEYHALIVELGKRICKKVPNCKECPIRELKEINQKDEKRIR